jgi:hypothetical protein
MHSGVGLRALLVFGFVIAGFATAGELSPSTTSDDRNAPSVKIEPADGARYFLLLGSYQSPTNAVKASHTFAVFFRARSEPGRPLQVVEKCCISWLPVSNEVSLARPAEPGVNKPLADTIALAEDAALEVYFEGPFEITAELFRRAGVQVGRLDRGDLRYKCMDRYTRDTAKNCMHAISDLVEENGRLSTYSTRGREATQKVAGHLSHHFVRLDAVVEPEARALYDSVNLGRYAPSPGKTNLADAVASGGR